MHYPLRVFRFLLLMWIFAPPAFGASVEAINKDQTRVILKLTQVELAAVEDDQTVLIEVTARPTFVVAGTLTKVNPVKKTVVLVMDQADPRLVKKQSARFLSLFFNPLLSPVLTSYSQYHQYARSAVEGGIGGVYEKYMERSGDSRAKAVLTGVQVAAESYALISPNFFGMGFGYRRVDGSSDIDSNGGKGKTDVVLNQLRPGAWVEIESQWVLGLRYDYTLLDVVNDNASFNYEFGELALGLTHFSPAFEFGVTFKDKSGFTAVDSTTDIAGKSFKVSSTIKTPATLDFAFRDIQSPLFGWGMGLGYVFYERELKQGDTLRSKPTIAEILRFRFTLEWRLDDGSKVDAALTYAGGRANNVVFQENIANKAGLHLSYAQPFLVEQMMLGGLLSLEGGAITLTDEAENTTTGEIEEIAREVETVGASVMIFARYEFDLLAKGRKR